MQNLKIAPISTSVAENVRATMKAPGYGFPAHREQTGPGRAPCRHCLKLIRPQAEELILFTYDAFHGENVPPMPGPIYIHAGSCGAYDGNGQIPPEYRGQPLTFEAFGANRKRLDEKRTDELPEGTDPDAVLQDIFEQSAVQYVHVRSTTAGCYLFRVERLLSRGSAAAEGTSPTKPTPGPGKSAQWP